MINPQQKKNPAAAAWIGRCPGAAALSLMVNVGKMFVCMDTVVRVARSAAAPASVDASKVRAILCRINFLFNEMPAIHVDRFSVSEGGQAGTRVDAWFWCC